MACIQVDQQVGELLSMSNPRMIHYECEMKKKLKVAAEETSRMNLKFGTVDQVSLHLKNLVHILQKNEII